MVITTAISARRQMLPLYEAVEKRA